MPARTHISKSRMIGPIQAAGEQKADFKPVGFWYGVDGDWERWCRGEQWGLHGEMFEHELALGKERLLVLSSASDIDSFHDEFKGELFPGCKYFEYVDWQRVAERWDGIEIAPYQWDRRLNGAAHTWYYAWDCASGCIWRPKGVTARLARSVFA